MTNIEPVVPAGGYISLPVTTDPSVLLQTALLAIAGQLPGWVPNEGQIDTLLVEQFAQMASESAVVASSVSQLIFQYLGQIYGLQPQGGVAATAPTTWTMIDTKGYTVPGGTVVAYETSGNTLVQFQTVADFTVAPGQQATAAGAVQIEAQVVGTAANGIASSTSIVPVQQLAFVQSIQATAATSGGVDPETIAAYLNRLSNLFTISAPRPIEAPDFALLAQSATDANGNSLGVARALAVNNLNPGRTITDATTNTDTSLVDPAGSFTADDVGRTVTGTGIAASTTISAYVSTTEVTLNNPTTATATNVTVTLGDLTSAERCVAVCAVDSSGNPLSSAAQSDLSSFLEARRELNFLVPMLQPTYTTINVTWTGIAQPGQDPNAVQSAGNAIVQAFLSPANWAGGNLTPPTWESGEGTVYYNELLGALSQAAGLARVATLTVGAQGGSMGTADVALAGDAPLPQVGTISGSVS